MHEFQTKGCAVEVKVSDWQVNRAMSLEIVVVSSL